MMKKLMVALAAPMAISALAQAQAPFASERVTITVQGNGPDVILVPGLTSNPRIYGGTVQALPGYRYHLVQVRGFSGTTPGANGQGDVAAPVAEEIARYIREQKLSKPAVIGHSMGGTIGMMLAARHPDLVGKLMVVDMVPFTGAFFGAQTAEQARAGFDARSKQMAAAGPDAGQKMMTAMIGGMVNNKAELPAVMNDAKTSDPGTVARAFREISTTDLRGELKAVKAPVTVLYVKPAGAPVTDEQLDATYRGQFANIAGVTLTRIPDAAHFIMLDAPQRFQAEVRQFLTR